MLTASLVRIARRPVFTLAEILIAIAVMAIVSAMVVPVVFSKLRVSQASAMSQTFVGLSQGIAEFKRATTRYPLLLASLTAQPIATDADICGNAITAVNLALWRWPYASRTISASGLQIGGFTSYISPLPVAGPPAFIMLGLGSPETDTR